MILAQQAENSSVCNRCPGTRVQETDDIHPSSGLQRDAMRDLAGSAPQLKCHLRDVDRYGRLVMRFANGHDIVGALVDRAGFAYRDFSTAYVENETRAAAAKRGVWQGRFSPPWEWRKK